MRRAERVERMCSQLRAIGSRRSLPLDALKIQIGAKVSLRAKEMIDELARRMKSRKGKVLEAAIRCLYEQHGSGAADPTPRSLDEMTWLRRVAQAEYDRAQRLEREIQSLRDRLTVYADYPQPPATMVRIRAELIRAEQKTRKRAQGGQKALGGVIPAPGCPKTIWDRVPARERGL